MTPTDDHIPEHGGDDTLAAEYVLGVLPLAERDEVARRIDTDAAFARLVDEWEMRLSPLGEEFEPVEPPAELKRALDGRLHGAEPLARRPGLLQSLAFWRGLAVAAVLALVALIVLFTAPVQWQQPTSELVASLAADESDVHYVVVYNGQHGDIGLSHVTGARAPGRDFELWVIEGDNPPASLGVIPVGSSVHLGVPADLRNKIAAGATFAITLEPGGGSPSGKPTGPVVAAGKLSSV